MAAYLTFFFSILLSSSIFFTIHSKIPENNNINQWCAITPYPLTCNQFMNHIIPVPKEIHDFRKMATQVALEKAINAHFITTSLGTKFSNEREKLAWADCMMLYEDTIAQLNNTLDPTLKCSDFDAQTWISTALTNLETCRDGFIELGSSAFFLTPLMSNSSSLYQMISNTLALGKASNYEKTTYNNGFPNWVSRRDRKLLQTGVPASNLVVAQDGSGDYDTVQAAISAASKRGGSTGRFVIYVKEGVYKENVVIGRKTKSIMVVGDGIGKTVITGSRSTGGGYTSFSSATFAVTGDRFMARDITFRNAAGPQNHQAVAFRSGADFSVFYRSSFEGYQDTLYVHSQRQFYRECNIYGTVDFIFGNAAVVFQSCMIYARKPMPGQKITITAQGRSNPNQNTGISIHNSKVQASSDLSPGSVKSYLGRPWKQYSRTVFLQTYLGSLINPAGWSEWSGNFALNTLYYGEYQNTGPGSFTGGRVKWKGYKVIASSSEAGQFSVANFIAGQSWLPTTGVPFSAGL